MPQIALSIRLSRGFLCQHRFLLPLLRPFRVARGRKKGHAANPTENYYSWRLDVDCQRHTIRHLECSSRGRSPRPPSEPAVLKSSCPTDRPVSEGNPREGDNLREVPVESAHRCSLRRLQLLRGERAGQAIVLGRGILVCWWSCLVVYYDTTLRYFEYC